MKREIWKQSLTIGNINHFVPNVNAAFLYPLKTSKNRKERIGNPLGTNGLNLDEESGFDCFKILHYRNHRTKSKRKYVHEKINNTIHLTRK